jgi:hypothetical protein
MVSLRGIYFRPRLKVRRCEHFEYGAGTFSKSAETMKTLLADNRFSGFVEDGYLASAHQKAPIASNTIVEACLLAGI